MALFAIGDLHLSLDGDKGMDIFGGWQDYVERLRENWNSTVTDQDTVVIIGDISWAMSLEEAVKDFNFINNELKGKKIILKGNHDYWWNTASKMNNFLDRNFFNNIRILSNNAYLCEGISVCGTRGWINETNEAVDVKILNREAGRLEMSIKDGIKLGGELVAFIHYPPIFGGEQNYFILEVLEKYEIKRCYYGHIHGNGCKKAFNGIRNGCEFNLLSADYVNFTPQKVNK